MVVGHSHRQINLPQAGHAASLRRVGDHAIATGPLGLVEHSVAPLERGFHLPPRRRGPSRRAASDL